MSGTGKLPWGLNHAQANSGSHESTTVAQQDMIVRFSGLLVAEANVGKKTRKKNSEEGREMERERYGERQGER